MSKKQQSIGKESIQDWVVDAMQEKKGKEIISLNFNKIPDAVTQYFVICHANSKTQARAIFDFVMEKVKEKTGYAPYHREGYENSEWLLIDYVDVVVHVFIEESRRFYNLEALWADAITTEFKSEA